MSDTALLREAGVQLDPETCGPRHNPETYETNVPGLYVIGAMVAGKASGKIFIENGRFHGQVAIDRDQGSDWTVETCRAKGLGPSSEAEPEPQPIA